jgi:hypothetical protein
MALIVSVLVLGLGAALVWGPDRSVGGVETNQIGVIVLAIGVIGVLASLLASRRAASERALNEGRGVNLEGLGWSQAATVNVEEAPEEEGHPFRPRPPKQPPAP